MYMLKALWVTIPPSCAMGALRFDGNRNQGRCAIVLIHSPDVTGDVRGGEEGSPQQRDDQKDESNGDCIVHGSL